MSSTNTNTNTSAEEAPRMSTTLDKVTTIAIGRDLPSGEPLGDFSWDWFRDQITADAAAHGLVVASVSGSGVGSDGVNADEPEETHIVIVINVDDMDSLRRAISATLSAIGSSSACFATDPAHEPVFPTPDGFRRRRVSEGWSMRFV